MNEELPKSGELSKSGLINNGEAKIIPTATVTANDGSAKPPINSKKKLGAFGMLKAALVKLRQRPPAEKPKQAKKEVLTAKERWKKLVGSMRPLHLQENHPSPPPSEPPMSRSSTVDNLEDMITPYSPAPSYSTATGGTMSQYASANNLQELDKHDGTMSQNASSSNLQELDKHDGTLMNLQELHEEKGEDPDEVFDSISADEMIDVKAEAFIAQFYQQMRLDQSHRHHPHHDRKGKNKV